MRKLRVSILLIVITLLLLVPIVRPTQKVNALGYQRYYTVYYTSTVGPACGECIVGEWYVDCYGHWSGNGWRPGQYPQQSRFDLTFGDQCFPE